ncbi:MAG: nuclear transport factor 2 (NTF2) superfamily protein [Saprospiraceae bacterium]|jgi:nuclear transport factor 2 (NTF2) superfamily protein
MKKILLPPFDLNSATAMVQRLEDVWNTINSSEIVLYFSEDTQWRNRDHFFKSRNAITQFLKKKWKEELNSYLTKELWSYHDNRIVIKSNSEWMCAKTGQWFRTSGNEHLEFDGNGLIVRREMNANDSLILERQRIFRK